MRSVSWTIASRHDLQHIDDWLTREADPDYAIRTLASIRSRAEFLVNFPSGGRPYRSNTRILRVLDTPYLIHYRIVGNLEVEVLRVYHERQNWQVET